MLIQLGVDPLPPRRALIDQRLVQPGPFAPLQHRVGRDPRCRQLAGRQQIGLWVSLASAYSAELVAGSGFDWLLIDTEHSPNEVDTTLAQLQAIAASPVAGVVRPAWNDTVLIKRHLDIGAQTLLVPYVQTEEEAAAAAAAAKRTEAAAKRTG